MNDFKELEQPNEAILKATLGEVLQTHLPEGTPVEAVVPSLPARRWELSSVVAGGVAIAAVSAGLAWFFAARRR